MAIFQELCQLNRDRQMMRQKSAAIIDCFLDSKIPPSIQVTAERELVEFLLERKSQVSMNMFNDLQVSLATCINNNIKELTCCGVMRYTAGVKI